MIPLSVKVLLDSGVGKRRKIIDVTSSTVSPIKRRVVVVLHTFSGNDHVSVFEKVILESDVKATRI